MPPKFGTSGLRGLVTEMTPALITGHVQAFLRACDAGTGLWVGHDLRASSPRILGDVIAAARAIGCAVTDCGAVPTPALALAADAAGAGAIMVTGSHIPDDRNGLKFYTPQGEISKEDEAAILAALAGPAAVSEMAPGRLLRDTLVLARYHARYVDAFGPGVLSGTRIGLYAHSAVGRDVLAALMTDMGAEVIELGRSETFIAVDTEAVEVRTRAQIADWVQAHALDALVSTDGDSDRPLLADETGAIVPGDIMGQITAEFLGAEKVVTPISSNSGVMRKGFAGVKRTRIGSPYVIAGMHAASGRVAGYEANGGFLLGFAAAGPAGELAPLMTRDCVLPLLAVLCAAGPGGIAARVAQEPPVVTLTERLQQVPPEKSRDFITRLAGDSAARAAFLASLGGTEASLDTTDGLRMTLVDDSVVHIRQSGNAPELRLYVESPDRRAGQALCAAAQARLREVFG